MKLTKYEHACLVLDEQGKQLVIDPSKFAESFEGVNDLAAVVITHTHFDHLDANKVNALIEKTTAPIFSTAEVAEQLAPHEVTVVKDGETYQAGPFALQFYGEDHAPIHESVDTGKNTGVLVNDMFYYPGDSFEVPDKPVKVLGAPVSGPWLKTGEVVDFLHAVKPKVIIPVHDALDSETGDQVTDNYLQKVAKEIGSEYRRLQPGESFEL